MADSVIIRIDGDDKNYQKVLKDVKTSVEGLNKIATRVALGVGAAAAAVVGMGVKYNAEMEQYAAGFTTMLGSAEKADKVISDLKSFAEKTPFELTDLANASTTLLAFGEDVENLMPDLKMLGDISLGNQEKFKSLALVFGQVQSQGRLMGQDLLQMINSGFNPLQIISEKTGESVASLKDKMSEGRISFEMVAEAMRIATSEGGQFYNAMETQSKTLVGQWSTLKDNVVSLAGEISSGISGKLTETVLPFLIEQVEKLKQMWEDGTLVTWIKNATVALVAFGGAVVGLNLALFISDLYQIIAGVEKFTAVTKAGTAVQAAYNAVLNMNPYVMILTAVTALIGGIITYCAITNDAKTANEELYDSLADIEKQTQDNIKAIEEQEDETLAEIAVTEKLFDRLLELDGELKNNTSETEDNAAKKAELKGIVDQLNKVSPSFQLSVNNETGTLNNQASAVRQLADDYIKLAKAKAYAEVYAEKAKEFLRKGSDLQDKRDAAWEEFEKQYDIKNSSPDGAGKINASYEMKGLADTILKYDEGIEEANDKANEYFAKAGEATKTVDEITNKYGTDFSNNTSTGGGGNFSTYSPDKTTTSGNEETPAEKEIRNLKHSYEMGEILAREYYENLEIIRDKYYAADSKEYQELSEEIKRIKDDLIEEDKQKLKEKHDAEIKDLDHRFNTGKISEKEYYEELARIRDDYFKEGDDEYYEYTLRIYQYEEGLKQKIEDNFKQLVDNQKNQLLENLNEIEQAQKSLASKLKSYGKLYSETTKTVYADKSTYKYLMSLSPEERKNINMPRLEGDKAVFENTSFDLGNFSKQTKTLEEYADGLDALKARTNIPREFFSIIRDMDMEEGSKFVNKLLSVSDSELENYINSWQTYQDTADRISKELFSDELSDIEKEFVKLFDNIPAEFFVVGEDSAKQFKDGFMDKFKLYWTAAEKEIAGVIGTLSVNVSVNSGDSSKGTNNYNTSNYYLQPAPGESTAGQLNATKNAETLKILQKGYYV